MLIEIDAGGAYHVLVADLFHVTTGNQPIQPPIRSFSTSEQLIEWIRKRPGLYKVLARVKGGPLTPYPSYGGYEADVLCGFTISISASGEVQQPGALGPVWGA